MKITHTVFKNEDLSDYARWHLKNIADEIELIRRRKGKKIDNTYIVINTDEPYIEEIKEVLRRNGHWEGVEK